MVLTRRSKIHIGEIPGVTPLLEAVQELGKRHGEQWANSPSQKDPTKTNSEFLLWSIAMDVANGRSIGWPYLNPIKNIARKGILQSVSTHGLSREQIEEGLSKYVSISRRGE